jgi:hypothetical protein
MVLSSPFHVVKEEKPPTSSTFSAKRGTPSGNSVRPLFGPIPADKAHELVRFFLCTRKNVYACFNRNDATRRLFNIPFYEAVDR